MYSLTLEEFRQYATQGNAIPVSRVIMADLETPVSAFLKLAQHDPHAFLLESVEQGEKLGRYSFIGHNPDKTFLIRGKTITTISGDQREETTVAENENPLDRLKEFMDPFTPVSVSDLPVFTGGLVGFLGYEMTGHFERLAFENRDDYDIPDAVFYYADTVIAFDHFNRTLVIISTAFVDGDVDAAYHKAIEKIEALVELLQKQLPPVSFGARQTSSPKPSLNWSKEEFQSAVDQCIEYIRAGDIFQVVIGMRHEIEIQSQPLDLYRALRRINPSPYTFFFRYDDLCLVGGSPEILVRLEEGAVTYRPIAGTRRRGKTPEEDVFFEKELLADPKEKAEHIMLVDLGRNDIGRVCDFHSVKVTDLMYIERYSHVMHIVSNVEGELSSEKDGFDLIRATFPAGTLSGSPKIRAMEIIEELEPTRRGPYAGAVGWFGLNGDMDFCITLRTIVVKGNKAYIQAGAGIVADSDRELEFKEVMNKSNAMLRAIELAECSDE